MATSPDVGLKEGETKEETDRQYQRGLFQLAMTIDAKISAEDRNHWRNIVRSLGRWAASARGVLKS